MGSSLIKDNLFSYSLDQTFEPFQLSIPLVDGTRDDRSSTEMACLSALPNPLNTASTM
jgi:hypothetical protein